MATLAHNEARRLISEIAGPRDWLTDEPLKSMFWRVSKETGFKPKTVQKLWKGEYESKKAIAKLEYIRTIKLAIAMACESDPALHRRYADVLRDQARRIHSQTDGR